MRKYGIGARRASPPSKFPLIAAHNADADARQLPWRSEMKASDAENGMLVVEMNEAMVSWC